MKDVQPRRARWADVAVMYMEGSLYMVDAGVRWRRVMRDDWIWIIGVARRGID